jgi:hypothetical protein
MAKVVCVFMVLCVIFDDPADEYASADALGGLPVIDLGLGDLTVPAEEATDFMPGTLRESGCVATAIPIARVGADFMPPILSVSGQLAKGAK